MLSSGNAGEFFFWLLTSVLQVPARLTLVPGFRHFTYESVYVSENFFSCNVEEIIVPSVGDFSQEF